MEEMRKVGKDWRVIISFCLSNFFPESIPTNLLCLLAMAQYSSELFRVTFLCMVMLTSDGIVCVGRRRAKEKERERVKEVLKHFLGKAD